MFPCVTSKQIKPPPPSRPDGLTYSRIASAVSLRDQAHGHGRSFHGKRKEKGIPRLRVLACQVHEAHDDFSLRICSAHCRSPVELSGKAPRSFCRERPLPPPWRALPAADVASADEIDDAQRRCTRAARISLSTVPTGRCAGRQTAVVSSRSKMREQNCTYAITASARASRVGGDRRRPGYENEHGEGQD